MRNTVSADKPRAVYRKHRACALQRNIVKHLIVGSLQKGRVDSKNGMKPGNAESARKCHCVLLLDTDIEKSLRIPSVKLGQTRAVAHSGGYGYELVIPRGDRAHLRAEHRRECRRSGRLNSDRRVKGADRMIPLRRCLGKREALTLFGDHMHNTYAVTQLGLAQHRLETRLVVTVDRPEIIKPHALEYTVSEQCAANAVLCVASSVLESASDYRHPSEHSLHRMLECKIRRVGTHLFKVARQSANALVDRHCIVIEQDNEIQPASDTVIHCLEYHTV